MSDIAHLKKTRQYWVAAWKVIDARPLLEKKPLKDVDDIVLMAVKDGEGVRREIERIVRDFSDYLGPEAAAAAHTFLNETTQVDLYPDEL